MDKEDFQQLIAGDSELDERIQILRRKSYSDIVDSDGRQYVDLVMEGGGMLGLALCGYTYALELAGIRFRSIGGTSAGALNAVLLSVSGNPSDANSLKVAAALAGMPAGEFLDSDPWTNFWVRRFLRGRLNLILLVIFTTRRFIASFGLIKGERFRVWLSNLLSRELETENLAALKRHLCDPACRPNGLRDVSTASKDEDTHADRPAFNPATDFARNIAIVATDVSTESKVVFPSDAKRYFDNPDSVCASEFVRASISIPYFFSNDSVTIGS